MSQSDLGGEAPFSFDPAEHYRLREEALHWQFEDIGAALLTLGGAITRDWIDGENHVYVTHFNPVAVAESPLGNSGEWDANISKREKITPAGVVVVRHSLIISPTDAAARSTTEDGRFRRPRLTVYQGQVALTNPAEFFNGGNQPARQTACNAWLNIATKSLIAEGFDDLEPVTLPA